MPVAGSSEQPDNYLVSDRIGGDNNILQKNSCAQSRLSQSCSRGAAKILSSTVICSEMLDQTSILKVKARREHDWTNNVPIFLHGDVQIEHELRHTFCQVS